MTALAREARTARPAGGARPTPFQRQQIRHILRSCPGLVAGGDLVLVYTPDRATEASWLCAYARAAEVAVRLAPVGRSAYSVERRARSEAGASTTCVVLADMSVSLPEGAIQLAGTPSVGAIDLWRSPDELRGLAGALADDLPVLTEVRTEGGQIAVRHAAWRRDAAMVEAAATVEAEVEAADGTFVADGAIAVNRPVGWDARLIGHPVTLTVRDRMVTAVTCPDPVLHTFLQRAVHTHRVKLAGALRIGVHPVECGFSPIGGPVNVAHPGLTLRLRVDASTPFSVASSDLCLDLTARWEGLT
jgi:hypothetical protein